MLILTAQKQIRKYAGDEYINLKNTVYAVKRFFHFRSLSYGLKLVVSDMVLNVISAYAPQVGHDESAKRQF